MSNIFRIHSAVPSPADLPQIDLTQGIGNLFDPALPHTQKGMAQHAMRLDIERAIANGDDPVIVSLFENFATNAARVEAAGLLIGNAVEAGRVRLVALMVDAFTSATPLQIRPLLRAYSAALDKAVAADGRAAQITSLQIVNSLTASVPQVSKDFRLNDDAMALGESIEENKPRVLRIALQIAAGADPEASLFGRGETVASRAERRALNGIPDLQLALESGAFMMAWESVIRCQMSDFRN